MLERRVVTIVNRGLNPNDTFINHKLQELQELGRTPVSVSVSHADYICILYEGTEKVGER